MGSLARSAGMSQTTLLKLLRAARIPDRGRPNAGRPPIPLDLDLIRGLRAHGLSTQEIAAQTGASEETVRRAMQGAGIDRLPAKARPDRNGFWAGGLTVDGAGYILAKATTHPRRTSSGYVRLHRLVMERSLGRLLEPQEVVDHLDGDTSDNRIRNLVLYPSNGEHLRATLTGRHALRDRLSKEDREVQRRAAVQRGRDRVSATHRERGSGAYLSPSELDLWIDELATDAPHP